MGVSLNAIKAVGGARLEADTILPHWASFAVLLISVAIYYLFLLSNGTFQLFAPEMLDKAFDNMLVLRGEFTVDREAIGYEAFTAVLYMPAGILSGLLWLLSCPTPVPVAHSEAAEVPVPIP